MEQQARAREAPDFIIDSEAGALLNTNNKGLQQYKLQRRNMKKSQSDSIRIDALESKLDRLEQLLLKVLEK